MRTILHIDFNSYFATVEQQANPRLRGKPIGVTGGDRMIRTVLGAASVEAKKFGVKTGMQIWQARQLCPQIILVNGDSDKYLYCTTKFLNILKDYSPYLEVFSIDECFLELTSSVIPANTGIQLKTSSSELDPRLRGDDKIEIAKEIKQRIRSEIGEWITCSIGISYNKLIAKLAGSLKKPDGLIAIENEQRAIEILDNLPLDEICGIGFRIQRRLNRMGIFNFKQLRQIPLDLLTFEFKSYGNFLYNAARGVDHTPLTPFWRKEPVKSIGHRHTMFQDTDDIQYLQNILLKLSEGIAQKLRAKKMLCKTVHFYFRNALESSWGEQKPHFTGDGMQVTIPATADGIEIYKAALKIFKSLWEGQKIRMLSISVSHLTPKDNSPMSFLEEDIKKEKIINVLDIINDKYGVFTLQRASLMETPNLKRKANSFLADRRFKV